MKHFIVVFLIFPFICFGQKARILLHSHNDYLQKLPLYSAIAFGANSIEVDVALFKDEIKVCHFPIFLKRKPNFDSLYLKHLLENKNHISAIMYLFIDVKSGGTEILEKLNLKLSQYPEIFASRNENPRNKLQVIISGSVDRNALVKNTSLNYLFADGGFGNLSQNIDSRLMPIVSANYKSMSEKERIEFINLAHKENKKVRFWNTNDNEKTWNKLVSLNVDLIGVDHLRKFSLFLNPNR